MAKKKIVFILNSIQQQRCLKRIEEFIEYGYEIEAYGFSRSDTLPTKAVGFNINVIGEIDPNLPIAQRFILMNRAIKKVRKIYQGQDVLYYYFLLDVAITSGMLSHKHFMYENSDLMYGYYPKLLRWIFKQVDRIVVKRSLVSIFTSAGFVEYLFGTIKPKNVVVIPNRLNKKVLQLSYSETKPDINHLRFAFVGALRQPGTKLFIENLLSHFPQHEFYFYGMIHDKHRAYYENLAAKYPQFHLGGSFSNPKDLPGIYEKCDILVSAMGLVSSPNIQYAEPNKFYEAIYFRKPIIVSEDSYVGRKVKSLGIGFCLSDFTENGIKSFLESITEEKLKKVNENLSRIPKEEAVDGNPQLFSLLDNLLSSKKL